MYVDVDVEDVYYEMSPSEREEMRDLLGTSADEFFVAYLHEYLDYLKFRLRIDPDEYEKEELLAMIADEIKRYNAD